MQFLKPLALAVLAALAPVTAVLAQDDPRPIIKVGVAALPDGLAPDLNISNVGQRITYSIFDQLIKRAYWEGEKGDGAALAPSIATAWRNVSPTEWEVDIRTDVKFQNGEPVTADDVAFSFSEQRLWGKDRFAPAGPTYFGSFKSVEVVDKDTVKFTTTGPDPIFPKRFTSPLGMVVPKDYYLKVGVDGFNTAPIGTGPYKLAEFKPHEYVKLVANDDYFGGKPPAKELWFVEVPEDAARISGLMTGELDMIANVTPDQQPVLENAGFTVAPVLIDNNRVIQLNTAVAPMNDVNLRRALVAAIDRESIVQALWKGSSVVPHMMNVPAHGDLYMPERPIVKFDPEEAKRLLAQSSYKGETLVFRILNGYYPNYIQAAQIMQQMWKDVGINVDIQVRDSSPAMREGTWHMINGSEGIQINDATQPIVGNFGRTAEAVNPKSKNYFWTPPEHFFELLDRLNDTLDEGQRKQFFSEALDIADDQVPEVELFQAVEFYAMRKGITWKPYSFWSMDFSSRNFSVK
ncbi:MAG TPA: ABC transporter substrate-binding protein [Devosiaceae bacterium]|jgi:peptide/nickel transport system substrate-binding protein